MTGLRGICPLAVLAGLSLASNAWATAFIDFGGTAPTPGANDVANLQNPNVKSGTNWSGSTDYSDNAGPPGQVFTTPGTAANSYTLTSIYMKGDGDSANTAGWTLGVFSVSGATLNLIDSETFTQPTSFNLSDYIQFPLQNNITLTGGSTYAFGVYTTAGFYGFSNSNSTTYTAGQATQIDSTARSFGTNRKDLTAGVERIFDANLTPAPEPTSFGLLGMAMVGLLSRRRRAV